MLSNRVWILTRYFEILPSASSSLKLKYSLALERFFSRPSSTTLTLDGVDFESPFPIGENAEAKL